MLGKKEKKGGGGMRLIEPSNIKKKIGKRERRVAKGAEKEGKTILRILGRKRKRRFHRREP